MANEGLLVCIYDKKNPHLYKDTLNNRFLPSYLDEVAGVGGGTFSILKNDQQTRDNPSLLGYRQVVRLKYNDAFIGGWIIERKKTIVVAEDGEHKEQFNVVGSGFLSWFGDAEVKPLGGTKRLSPDNRSFSFASEPGDWYNPSDWVNPVELGTVYGVPVWGEQPEKWPEPKETAAAKWLWAQAYTGNAPEGTCYFRKTFTVVADGTYVFYLAGDDRIGVYLDGAQIVADTRSGLGSTTKVEVTLTAGTHYLGVRATNDGGAAGILASMYRKGDDNTETLIFNSNATGWKAMAYPTDAPGWTPGEIMLTLMAEAEARGVLFPTWVTPTFTAELDSNGNPWGSTYDWTFKVGESLLSVLNKITELGNEAWIDPTNFDFFLGQARGEDRSTGPNSVVFEKGKNLVAADSEGVGKIKNSLSVKTADGWLTEDNQDDASIDEYGVVEGNLQLDASEPIAKALVGVVFGRRAMAEEGASYKIFPTEDEVPFDKFYAGDWVEAPNDRDEQVPRRAVSVSLDEDEAQNLRFTVEFDTVFQTSEQRINKLLGKQAGAGIGSGFSNAVGIPSFGVPVVVTPGGPPAKYPKAPILAPAVATGYWAANGISPLAQVALNWSDVIENTDETDLIPYGYKTEAREDGVSGWEEAGTVTDSDAIAKGFQAGSTWSFRVQTIGEGGVVGVYSNEVSVTMPLPAFELDEPTTPEVEAGVGVVNVYWDGFLDESLPSLPPASWAQTEVEFSDTEAGTYSLEGVTLGGAWVGVQENGTYWVRLRARDRLGRLSAPSIAVEVTLDSDILAIVEAAQEAADNALDAANAAQITADGRNRIFWSIEEPDPTPGPVNGDMWYGLDADDRVTGISQWNGTEWVDYRLIADSLVIPGSVGNILLADGAITAPKITASEEMWARVLGAHKINADEVNVGALTAAIIQAGSSQILTLTAAQAINLIVTNLVPIQDQIDGNTSTLAIIGQFFEFLSTGLRISAPDSPFSVNLDNDSLDFLDGSNVRAWLTAAGFFAERMSVTNDLSIGAMKIAYDSTLGLTIQPAGA